MKTPEQYCQAFYDWHKVLVQTCERIKAELAKLPDFADDYVKSLPQKDVPLTYWKVARLKQNLANWNEVIGHLNALQIPIMKSNFLARHVYDSEPLRTEPCPEHKGRWSGCVWGDQACEYGCMYGANVTGWLPQPHAYLEPPADREPEFDKDGKITRIGIRHNQGRCYQCGGTAEKGLHGEA